MRVLSANHCSCVAVVLGDIEDGRRPLPLQSVGRRRGAVQLHDRQRPQREPGFSGIRRQIEILPDDARSGAVEFVQPCQARGDAAFDAHHAGRRVHGDQTLALARIARHPAALHQHHVVRRDLQRRDDEEAGPTVHLPVVEVDAVRRQPAAFEHDPPMLLFGRHLGRARQLRRIQRRQRTARQQRLVQRRLLRGAVQLPEAQPCGGQRAGNGGQQHDERAQTHRCDPAAARPPARAGARPVK